MKKIVAVVTACLLVGVSSAQSFPTVLEWMSTNGLTKFTTEAEFRPDDTVTRGEISKFFTKFAEVQGLSKTRTEDECRFDDIENYDYTLVPTIVEACEYGLIKWHEGNYYPTNSLTEAEALTVIVRALMGMQDETKDPRWSEYYDVGKWLGILENEGVRDLNKNALRGKIGTRLYRAAQTDPNSAQDVGNDELKNILVEIFGEDFRTE